MYGVVLWSDEIKNCAVIWCEDHRKLAYYKNETADTVSPTGFRAGDLVEFDVHEMDDMRLALDPSLVSAQHYPSLPETLIAAGGEARKTTSLPRPEGKTARVIAFRKPSRPCSQDRPEAKFNYG